MTNNTERQDNATLVVKRYCDDCDRVVHTKVYNDTVDPPVLICSICGQFCYERRKIDMTQYIKRSEVEEAYNKLYDKNAQPEGFGDGAWNSAVSCFRDTLLNVPKANSPESPDSSD